MRSIRYEIERLGAPPSSLAETRSALHRLAVYAVSPAREAVTGRIGLRAADATFATPLFGDDETQVMVVGDELARSDARGEQRIPITSLADAAEFLGVQIDTTRSDRFDVPAAGDINEKLSVDAAASTWLGSWYRFGDSVLEAMRAGFRADEDVSIVQLWPEHFDLAISGGVEADGARANFGISPGDAVVDEPYVYVGAWNRDGLDDSYWGESGLAVLSMSELTADHDRRGAALAFMRRGRDLLRK